MASSWNLEPLCHQLAIRISSGDREIGAITSAVASPSLGAPIALGYVHRDFVQPGTSVTVDRAHATVTQLPFVPLESAVNRVAANSGDSH